MALVLGVLLTKRLTEKYWVQTHRLALLFDLGGPQNPPLAHQGRSSCVEVARKVLLRGAARRIFLGEAAVSVQRRAAAVDGRAAAWGGCRMGLAVVSAPQAPAWESLGEPGRAWEGLGVPERINEM